VRSDSFMSHSYVVWLIYVTLTHSREIDSFWHIKWDLTHSCPASTRCEPMTHLCVTWLIQVRSDSFTSCEHLMRMSQISHEWVNVTYIWVIPHMNESCRTRTGNITHECVTSHMNASCHIWTNHITHLKL